MTKLDWGGSGTHVYEEGIDRGVLYVDDDPGVPWNGLIQVTHSTSGGKTNPRYLDGVQISNRASSEQFEGTIEAYTYPVKFERCDGTYRVDNGLQIAQQRRRPFGLSYRSRVGNERVGSNLAYKIHILYNLRAEPAEKGYRTLSDQNQPLNFSWKITSRAERISGFRPSAYFSVDSRDVPNELLATLEDMLYGTETTDPALPSPAELIFLFDSFEDNVYDAGSPFTPVFVTYDAGDPYTSVTDTIDGGAL